MDSLRKSFNKSSYKQLDKSAIEELSETHPMKPEDKREVVVNVDGSSQTNGTNLWRESSYDFWPDKQQQQSKTSHGSRGRGAEGFEFQMQDSGSPPTKLINQFLHKQQASGEISLDMDLDMEELQFSPELQVSGVQKTENPAIHLPPLMETRQSSFPKSSISRESKVSFEIAGQVAEARRRYSHSHGSDEDGGSDTSGSGKSGEVLKCSSRSTSIPRNSSLLRTKTKSRLIDPPFPSEAQPMKSGHTPKSGQMGGKSGMLNRLHDEEEEDPFSDEDLPDEFRRGNLDAMTVIQWVSLFVILGAFICSLTIPALSKQNVWDLHLWKWVLMVLVLICGRLVSGWGIRIAVFFIERNFLLRKRVLYFVYGVRKAVQNCLWLGLVLIAWHYIFDKKVERETSSKILPYVSKVLVCLLVGTLIWLVKILLVKSLASSFHVSTYFDRIQDSLFNQYAIETLSGPPSIEIQQVEEEREKVMAEVRKFENAGNKVPPIAGLSSKSVKVLHKSRVFDRSPKVSGAISGRKEFSKQQDEVITIDHLHKLNQNNISAWNMKRLMNIVRNGALSTLDESAQNASSEDESAMHIRSEYEAKAAAKKIFNNVAKRGAKYFDLVDLLRFMREDEAQKTMSLFEGTKETKRVSKMALRNWVVHAFRERRHLSLTLNDTKTAVNKLHQMVNVVVCIIVLVIWLLILGIATTHLLVFISSQLLLVVFIFGNSCKMVFEAIIFLFVMHPFDVGDRCEIDSVQMIVEEMNILTTVFLRYDNQKITYPNTVLATLPISNYYRSPDMGDTVEFSIHLATPMEKIALLKERIKGYIESKPDHWYENPTVVLKDVENMNKIKLAVWLQHKMNHQEMGERWVRRAQFVEEMIRICRDLEIEYRMLPVDVNLRPMPQITSTRLPSTWTTSA
ncbi:hypothetical protein AMTRI_Chr09g34930 [Amborella trichopoda]